MGSKAKYVCTACAEGFTRRSSATRHIEKKELGQGFVLSEAQYRVYLSTGMIPPPTPRSLILPKKKENLPEKIDTANEIQRGFNRRLGELLANDAFLKMTDQEKNALRLTLIARAANEMSGGVNSSA